MLGNNGLMTRALRLVSAKLHRAFHSCSIMQRELPLLTQPTAASFGEHAVLLLTLNGQCFGPRAVEEGLEASPVLNT